MRVRLASLEDVIASKEWANRPKDHEALPELYQLRDSATSTETTLAAPPAPPTVHEQDRLYGQLYQSPSPPAIEAPKPPTV